MIHTQQGAIFFSRKCSFRYSSLKKCVNNGKKTILGLKRSRVQQLSHRASKLGRSKRRRLDLNTESVADPDPEPALDNTDSWNDYDGENESSSGWY